MSLKRIDLCKYYKHVGLCKKGITEANHWHYCQNCNMYKPKRKIKIKNSKQEIIITTLVNERNKGGTKNNEK